MAKVKNAVMWMGIVLMFILVSNMSFADAIA